MPGEPVASDHDFFDPAYVRRWAEETERRNPQRPQFFDVFVDEVNAEGPDLVVVELGSGPGALAEHVLSRCAVSAYYLVDYSPEMHRLSRERLVHHGDRTRFVQADFRHSSWVKSLPTTADVVVTMQALHELRHVDRAPGLYRQLRSVVRPSGLVLVCDHLRPPGDDRPLFMSVAEHLGAMEQGGLTDADVVHSHPSMGLFRARLPGRR